MRAVVTGMALNTPLGDRVDQVLDALLAGRSGIGPWRAFPRTPQGAAVGGDLSGYDVAARIAEVAPRLPADVQDRLRKMVRRVPWGARLSLLVAADAAVNARFWQSPLAAEDVAVVLGGHNLAPRYGAAQWETFQSEPDYIDALQGVHMLDTNHAACVSELLGTRGPIGTVGAACASGNLALRAAIDELADGARAAVVVSGVYDYAPVTLQSLGAMGATTESTDPSRASRPFDEGRDGFVPSHGAAAVILEPYEAALARGAPILAEILAVEASSDACHRPPKPDPVKQAALFRRALDRAGITPDELDLVSAHAASTPQGDLAEGRALALALGDATARVPVQAPKAMLGHTGWSAALVELVLLVAQMHRGAVHGTPTLAHPDPRVPLNFVPSGPREVRTALNDAFGFGGLNCVSVVRKMTDG